LSAAAPKRFEAGFCKQTPGDLLPSSEQHRAPASARARSCRHHYRAFIAHTSRLPIPVLRLGTLASRFWPLGLSPFTSERLVPAVPCNRLHPLHALSTPATTCSVTRHPAGLSQKSFSPLVLTALDFLTTRPQGFTFVRLSDAHLREFSSRFSSNAHYHGS
jgi:hypothetical protein